MKSRTLLFLGALWFLVILTALSFPVDWTTALVIVVMLAITASIIRKEKERGEADEEG